MTADVGHAVAAARAAVEKVGSDEEARGVVTMLRLRAQQLRARAWRPYVWQHPHRHPAGWVSQTWPGKDVCDHRCALLPAVLPPVHGVWVQRGGRGTGKTEGAAHYVDAHVNGPPCDTRVPGGHRLTIIAPTQADAVSSCVEGVSGLKAINPLVGVSTGREGTISRWPNGSVARLLGAHSREDVQRVRAWTNICLAWVEEAAAMTHLGGLGEADSPQGVLDQLPFTLRMGDTPHIVVTTTPQNRPEVKVLLSRPDRVETWGRTRDAHRLPDVVRAALDAKFGGTTAGAQELDGDLIADTPGALWVSHRPTLVDGVANPDQRPGIGNDRIDDLRTYGWRSHDPEAPPPPDGALLMERVVVAVDPPGGRTECGITVHGTIGQHGYLLADLSIAGPPDTWAGIVLRAYRDYGAEGIAAEHTYGGDMVTDVISTRASGMIETGELASMPPIFRVPTKVGKRLRAEPVQALGQQHRLHHLGYHPGVETEQTTWVPGDRESPNRLDSYVHGFTYLLIRNAPGQIANPARSRAQFRTTTGR